MCFEQSRFSPEDMFEELASIARDRIAERSLQKLVLHILDEHRFTLLSLPAATKNHHAYVGGYLEHVLSVTKSCVYLADKYDEYYPDLQPRLDCGMVVAGAILHDIGKLREIEQRPEGAAYTSAGHSWAIWCRVATSFARPPRRLGCRWNRKHYCGSSTLSCRTSGCPNGARPSRQ